MNLHGWYTGDGALYVFLPAVEGHYSDAYWPTVDAKLIPGTTEKELHTAGIGTGAGDPAGLRWSAMGQPAWRPGAGPRLPGRHVDREEVVVLRPVRCVVSSGRISPTRPIVRTTVENRNLGENGGVALLIDGRPYTTELGTAATLSNTRWLHLRGVGGYVPRRRQGLGVA
jgi:hyaluronate lyase